MNYALEIISLPSKLPVGETVNKLVKGLSEKGITIYARIDQKAEAAKAGLEIRSMELLLFGNPRSGIPLAMKEPLVALDLPLKALAWEADGNAVWVSLNSAKYLQNRFALPDELMKPIAGAELLIKSILEA